MKQQDPLIGRQIGNYRLERLLGRGGMASVYLAWDVNLHRPVAVKLIGENYRSDPAFTARFLREARAVAALQHPNIVHIFHAGEQDGISFFAMKYIEGSDLRNWLRGYTTSSRLPPYKEVLRIGKAIAAALDYAHENGVIHRDVKPSNVLLAEDGRVVLTDFGLAMQAAAHETMGEVFGSPQYISPEQARRSSNAVPQSDLYSLGVMLFEMLTGRLPFEDASPATLALQHMTQPPPSPRQFNPALSPAVEAVLLKALNKNPHERFRSGKELLEALEQALFASDTVPAAVAAPAVVPETQPVRTSVDMPKPVADYRSAEQAAGPPPPVYVPPIYRRAPRRSPFSPLMRWSTGCLLALLLCGVLAAVALNQGQRLITPIPATQNPEETAVSLPTETPPTSTAEPSQTDIPPTSTLEPSPTEMPPTSTPEPSPTEVPPTRTLEPSPTQVSPTGTPAPTATLQPIVLPETGLVLLLARNNDDSLFVVNLGPDDFPLRPLRLGNNQADLSGREWEIDTLEAGKCVAVWKDSGRPKPPENLECDLVGKRLEREAGERFWAGSFVVEYRDEHVMVCSKDDNACLIEFLP